MIWFRAAYLALVGFTIPAALLAQSTDRLYQAIGPVGPFSLTERGGKTVTREDLRGTHWIAHFFYCTCEQGCAQTTANMARLQKALADRDGLRLVSIHVNPHDEDPEMLDQFAKAQGADPERWWFLRADPKALQGMLETAFKVGWGRDPKEPLGRRVTHSFFLFLIDPEGEVIGYVDGRDPAEVDRLADRVRGLTSGRARPPEGNPGGIDEDPFRQRARVVLPSLNASLNALCTVLLLTGYLAIRRRRETFHKVCMLSAVGVSLVFLTSYLYYHFAILEGRPTSFTGEGLIRPVYFGVLLSHTVLAAVAAPLALVTTYVGLRDRRAAHRRLARWTFPIWLYVSVTGVVVYWMLYHLYPPV